MGWGHAPIYTKRKLRLGAYTRTNTSQKKSKKLLRNLGQIFAAFLEVQFCRFWVFIYVKEEGKECVSEKAQARERELTAISTVFLKV